MMEKYCHGPAGCDMIAAAFIALPNIAAKLDCPAPSPSSSLTISGGGGGGGGAALNRSTTHKHAGKRG